MRENNVTSLQCSFDKLGDVNIVLEPIKTEESFPAAIPSSIPTSTNKEDLQNKYDRTLFAASG